MIKTKIGFVISFLVGLLGGAIGTYWITYHEAVRPRIESENGLYMSWVLSDISTAVYLRENKQDYLLNKLDNTILPHEVLALRKEYSNHPDAPYFLWRIKRYYNDFSISPPAETKSILDGVPVERPRNSRQIGNEDIKGSQ